MSASITGIRAPESMVKQAPPPVLLCEILSLTPRELTRALVCPPPTIVSAADSVQMLRISMVPKANCGFSK